MQMVVEKLIGNRVVLLNKSEARAVLLPIDILPDGLRVGDCVELAVLPDVSRLEEVKREITDLLSGLAGGGFKGMRRASEQAVRERVLKALTELVRIDGDRYYLRNLSHAAETITRAVVGGR